MKILKIDRKSNYLEILPQSVDDLWHLSKILEKEDLVSGSSERKIKPKDEGGKAFKQKIFVELQVEKAELSRSSATLRISGIIVSGSPEELIELKSHHSLEVEPGTILKLKKKKLFAWQLERLEKAQHATKSTFAIILDDEFADFYEIKAFSNELLARVALERKGKRFESEEKKMFVELKKIIDAKKPDFLAIAGPGFEKESLQKFLLESSFKGRIALFSLSSAGITGLNELLAEEKFLKAVGKNEMVEETRKVEHFFESLGKGKPTAYGIEDVKNAVSLGAVAELLVAESLFSGKREELEALLENAESTGAKVSIISSESEARRKLEGIGGIAALLRYKI